MAMRMVAYFILSIDCALSDYNENTDAAVACSLVNSSLTQLYKRIKKPRGHDKIFESIVSTTCTFTGIMKYNLTYTFLFVTCRCDKVDIFECSILSSVRQLIDFCKLSAEKSMVRHIFSSIKRV